MIVLRAPQKRMVAETREAFAQRKRSVCLCAATGSGKRIIACWICIGAVGKQKRVAIVTDRQLLVRQMADECNEHNIPYGIRMGSEARNDDAPVQICSIQTLKTRKWKDNPDADLIIIDEAHKDESGYAKLIAGYPPSTKVLLLTATPVGANGKKLVNADVILEPVTNTQLIRDGWLLRTQVMTPSEPDVKGVSISAGEFSQKQLGERMRQCTVFADIFKWWQPYSNKQTIVFVPGVEFAYGVAEQFRERGHPAQVIEAGTKKSDRSTIIEDFKNGDLRVLVSVDVLKEGFDAPIAQCGIDLQPNHQLRTYWQKIGRVKRPHEHQDKAYWLDFAGNFWRHLHPDEDPEWPTNGETTKELVEKAKKKKEEQNKEPWSCPSCSYTLSPWEKITDGKCPNCGREMKKALRRIIMQDGTMKTVSAKQRKKKKADTAVSVWFQCLYPAFYKGKTLGFAGHIYMQRMGNWPDHRLLPFCPHPRSGDWKRTVRSLYPQLRRK